MRGVLRRYAACLIEFLFVAVPSPHESISALFIFLMVAGFFFLYTSGRTRLLFTLLGIIAFYIFYFSQQVVFIARNYIFLFPRMTIAAGFGVMAIWNALSIRGIKWGQSMLGITLLCAIGWNSWFIVWTADTIAPERPLTELFSTYARNYDGRGIAVSPRLKAMLGKEHLPKVKPIATADLVAFLTGDLTKREIGPFDSSPGFRLTEWPGYYREHYRWIGPWEVDFNYYPTWVGRERILLFS